MAALDVPLVTRRLRLVPLTPALASAALAGRPLPGGLAAASDWPTDDAGVVLARVAESRDGSGQWLLALPTGLVLGECGIRAWPRPDEPEIGYGLAPHARGRGLATESVTALVDHLLALPGVRGVRAETDAENRPSGRLLRRLGFRRVSATVWRATRADVTGGAADLPPDYSNNSWRG